MRNPDEVNVFDDYYRRGWTDGLPIIPPTTQLVEAMMATVALPAEHPVGFIGRMIEVRYQEVTPDGSLRFPTFVCFRNDR